VRLLGADHVFDSRSLAFADEVLQATAGEGVDVVLNSLAGDAIPRNLRLLRPFGRMLRAWQARFLRELSVGLRPFRNNISYFGIDADQLLEQRPERRRVFVDLMALFADGTLQPLRIGPMMRWTLPVPSADAGVAPHRKIVVTFPPDFAPLGPALTEAPRLRFAPSDLPGDGGLSGFGLRTARWLVQHGARHLALLSRRGAVGTPDAAAQLLEFDAQGVTIAAPACDVADLGKLRDTLDQIDRTCAARRCRARGQW